MLICITWQRSLARAIISLKTHEWVLMRSYLALCDAWVRAAVFLFVTENVLSHTCVVLKTYDAIYSVVYVLESNAYNLCAISPGRR